MDDIESINSLYCNNNNDIMMKVDLVCICKWNFVIQCMNLNILSAHILKKKLNFPLLMLQSSEN
jgi:hypothetical protein